MIIHNGIIENYESLKKELTNRGYTFESDTDTEVLINLIEDVKNKENVKLGKAVQVALNQVVGAYAISVFDRNKPNEIVVARLGSPLAIGVGEDEYFIALTLLLLLNLLIKGEASDAMKYSSSPTPMASGLPSLATISLGLFLSKTKGPTTWLSAT